MTITCLIPARSGSKRIPDKNLQLVGAKPLLGRAIETALEAFGAVYVSTDSDRYAEVAVAMGATVPGLRPPELATDVATTTDVVRHALAEWTPEASIVVVMQATSPFTTATDLLGVAAAVRDGLGESAMTVAEVGRDHAFLLAVEDGAARFLIPELRALRTQDVPHLAVPTGGAYAAPASRVRTGGELVVEPIAVVVVPASRSLDIDDLSDLERARLLAGGD